MGTTIRIGDRCRGSLPSLGKRLAEVTSVGPVFSISIRLSFEKTLVYPVPDIIHLEIRMFAELPWPLSPLRWSSPYDTEGRRTDFGRHHPFSLILSVLPVGTFIVEHVAHIGVPFPLSIVQWELTPDDPSGSLSRLTQPQISQREIHIRLTISSDQNGNSGTILNGRSNILMVRSMCGFSHFRDCPPVNRLEIISIPWLSTLASSLYTLKSVFIHQKVPGRNGEGRAD